MSEFMSGAMMMGCFVAGLFFIRFWRQSRDRLFLMFGIAFWVLGINRIAMLFVPRHDELHLSLYAVRLLAFLLILAAIIDKNHRRASPD